MNEVRSTETDLSRSLLNALKDCAEYSKHRPYVWKPKSMVKLAELGMVEPEVLAHMGQTPYSPTAKGLEYLEKHR